MAPRPNWKGYLKLSLVSCSVALYPATTHQPARPLQHHQPRDRQPRPQRGGRCRNRRAGRAGGSRQGLPGREGRICAGRGRGTRQGGAGEHAHHRHRAVRADVGEVDEIYLDESYYIVPQDKVGAGGIRGHPRGDAQGRLVGLARVVLYRRERILMLQPRGKGMMATALRYKTEVRDEKDYFDDIADIKVADRHARARRRTSSKARRAISIPAKFEDRYEDALQGADQGQTRRQDAAESPSAKPSNVINLMDALRRSVKASAAAPAGPRADRARDKRASHAPQARAARAQEAASKASLSTWRASDLSSKRTST